nr:hypothetical protein GCM10020092_040250 [Actinoplanes digitatis]
MIARCSVIATSPAALGEATVVPVKCVSSGGQRGLEERGRRPQGVQRVHAVLGAVGADVQGDGHRFRSDIGGAAVSIIGYVLDHRLGLAQGLP